MSGWSTTPLRVCESESCRHTHAGPHRQNIRSLAKFHCTVHCGQNCRLPIASRVQVPIFRQGRPHVSRAPPSPSIRRRTDKECPFSRCSICSSSLDAQTKNGNRLPIPVPAPNTIPPSSTTIHTTPSTPARRGFDRPSTLDFLSSAQPSSPWSLPLPPPADWAAPSTTQQVDCCSAPSPLSTATWRRPAAARNYFVPVARPS